MRHRDIRQSLTQNRAQNRVTSKAYHLTVISAFAVFALALTTKLAVAAPAFKPKVQVTDALLQNRTSKIWKQHPWTDDPGYQYLVAAQRPDGAVAVLTRVWHPDSKTLSIIGNFMKCGVHKIWAIPLPNAAAFNAQLAHPDIDDPQVGGFPLVDESANDVLYHAGCGKKS